MVLIEIYVYMHMRINVHYIIKIDFVGPCIRLSASCLNVLFMKETSSNVHAIHTSTRTYIVHSCVLDYWKIYIGAT